MSFINALKDNALLCGNAFSGQSAKSIFAEILPLTSVIACECNGGKTDDFSLPRGAIRAYPYAVWKQYALIVNKGNIGKEHEE